MSTTLTPATNIAPAVAPAPAVKPQQPTKVEADVTVLLDYARAHPQGFTVRDAAVELDWYMKHVDDVIREVRRRLADTPENLICDPQPEEPHGPWAYRLVSDYVEAKPWLDRQTKTMRTHLESAAAVSQSMVVATDGRTAEGKLARTMQKMLAGIVATLIVLMGD